MTATEPLDPAAIMAEHRRPNLGSWCIVCWDGEDDRSGDWPCLPYRLAVALVEANRKLAEAQAGVRRARTWFINSVDPAEVGLETKQQMLDLRAALGGDHA